MTWIWYDPLNPPARIKRQLGGGQSWLVACATLSTGEIIIQRLDGNSLVYIGMLVKNITPLLLSRFGQMPLKPT